MAESISEPVLKNLETVFTKEEDAILSSLILFLASDGNAIPRYNQVLEYSLNRGKEFFRNTVRQMAEDAIKAKDDSAFKDVMRDIWFNYLQPFAEGPDYNLNLQLMLANPELTGNAVYCRMLIMLSKMPPGQVTQIVRYASDCCSIMSRDVGALVTVQGERALSKLTATGGKVVAVALVAVFLAYEAFLSIYGWYKGEITGKRCVKNILDSTSSILAGAAGGAGGGTLGLVLAGPVGMIVGGVIGTIVAGEIAQRLSDWLTRYLFDLPKDKAVENAYNFLNAKPSASNDVVNKCFRDLCLKYHPDKGGKAEDWYKLQSSMALIKFDRGEKAY